MSRTTLLRIVLVLLIGGAVVEWFSFEPGYVLIAFADTTIESSLWFAVLALLAALLIANGLLRVARIPNKARQRLSDMQQTIRQSEPKTQKTPRQAADQRVQTAQNLLDSGDYDTLIKFIEQQLPGHWDKRLARLYGLARDNDARKQLKRAERWLKNHPKDEELLLCLGRLRLRCAHWEQAEDYLKKSLQAKPTAEAYAELGRLLERQEKTDESVELFRLGLLAATEKNLTTLPAPQPVAAKTAESPA